MVWTSPTTRVTGELITAAIWNTDLTDNLSFLHARLGILTVPPRHSGGSTALVGDWLTEVFANNAAGTYSQFPFVVPDDFAALTSAEIAVVATAASFTMEYDINSDYFNPDASEAYNVHSEAVINQTTALTQNVPKLISCAGALASLAAGDFVSLRLITSAGAANNWYPLLCRLVYSRT